MSNLAEFPLDESLAVQDAKGTVVLQVGLLATFYFPGGHTAAGRQGVIGCWEEYLALCGDELRWAIDLETKVWRDLSRNPFPPPREWLPGLDADSEWMILCHGGEHFNTASPYRFTAFGRPAWESTVGMSCVQAGLPLTWFANHEGRFVDFVTGWAGQLRADSGYAGIGLMESQNRETALDFQSSAYQFAQRFPGLEIDAPISHSRFVVEGIKGVDWLTILADRWLDKLGGAARLRSLLDSDFTFLPYTGGMVIQAGAKPQLGDMRLGRRPERYVQLNSILRPIRVAKLRKFHEGNAPDRLNTENTIHWLSRFD